MQKPISIAVFTLTVPAPPAGWSGPASATQGGEQSLIAPRGLVPFDPSTSYRIPVYVIAVAVALAGCSAVLILVFADASSLAESGDGLLLALLVGTGAGTVSFSVKAAADGLTALWDRHGVWSRMTSIMLVLSAIIAVWAVLLFSLPKFGMSD